MQGLLMLDEEAHFALCPIRSGFERLILARPAEPGNFQCARAVAFEQLFRSKIPRPGFIGYPFDELYLCIARPGIVAPAADGKCFRIGYPCPSQSANDLVRHLPGKGAVGCPLAANQWIDPDIPNPILLDDVIAG